MILPEKDMIRKTEELISGKKQCFIHLTSVSYEDFYFRALFIRARIKKPLLSLHNQAKKIFDMQDTPTYMPHLSLLYGDFPSSVKENMIEKIGKDYATQFAIIGIHLFKTDGKVETWRKVKEFSFL